MKQPLTLAQRLCAPCSDGAPIAWQEEHTWMLGHLCHDMAQLLAYLRQQEGERWALYFESSYLFTVVLLTTLRTGKTSVILGHCRVSLLNEQHLLFDGALSDKAMDWQGTLRVVSSAMTSVAHDTTFPAIHSDASVELFTSGPTGQPKRVIKPIVHLDSEVALLATRFVDCLTDYRVVASVVPQHLYGLTFRIFLPMVLGLPLHTVTFWYAEQLAALNAEHRYAFINSPASLKCLDHNPIPPPVGLVLSVGGVLSWQNVMQVADWLSVWPSEIYSSTETGILAWRYRHRDDVARLPFPGVRFQSEDDAFRALSPPINVDDGLLFDDVLQFIENGQLRLMGRRERVIKIEEKRTSSSEVGQRLLALDGICEVVTLSVSRGGRQGIGVLLILNDEARQR